MQLWLCVLVLKKIQQKWDTIHDLETWACGSRHRPLETKWSQDSEHYPLLSLKTETKDIGEFPGSWFHKLYIDRRTEKTVCSFVFPLINYLLLLLLSGFNCVWTSTNIMLKITRFSNFIRIKFALAFHLLCVPSSRTPLDQFSSFLASSLFGLLSPSLYWTGLTEVPNNSYIVQSSGWFSILVTLDPPAAFDSTLHPTFDSTLPGFLACGPGPSLPVPSYLFPLYLVLMLPLLESKLWARFLGPHFAYFTDCYCCC